MKVAMRVAPEAAMETILAGEARTTTAARIEPEETCEENIQMMMSGEDQKAKRQRHIDKREKFKKRQAGIHCKHYANTRAPQSPKPSQAPTTE